MSVQHGKYYGRSAKRSVSPSVHISRGAIAIGHSTTATLNITLRIAPNDAQQSTHKPCHFPSIFPDIRAPLTVLVPLAALPMRRPLQTRTCRHVPSFHSKFTRSSSRPPPRADLHRSSHGACSRCSEQSGARCETTRPVCAPLSTRPPAHPLPLC